MLEKGRWRVTTKHNPNTFFFILNLSLSLKTGLFKWKKDYEKAAMYLEEAAVNYKNGKNFVDSVKTY